MIVRMFVEPIEETRNEIIFATEHVVGSLATSITESSNPNHHLDEVETQKGLLQLARGLEFLHSSSRIHTNLTPESVVINAKGDWKLGGVGFVTNLSENRWALADDEDGLPQQLQRNLNYMDPVYVFRHKVESANDMYSLGVLLYAIFHNGATPYNTHGNISTLRSYADRLSERIHSHKWSELPTDVQNMLDNLISLNDEQRYTASAFQSLPFFNSILVSVLKFMERDNFTARPRQEKVQFLRGLHKMLPRFSAVLQRRKLLPNLLEMMSDKALLPYILPNVFTIAKNLSALEFGQSILPRLKPLFLIKDPPQNQMLLLNQTDLFMSKTQPSVFRKDIMPLFYSVFEQESVAVQENALQKLPNLISMLEFSHVKDVLLPKLAALFTKTKTLSVKVRSLVCFHAMISVLDKGTIGDTLVPVLGRVKTREPSVMIASLTVYEAFASKLDIDVQATAVIPRLWVMSMCPALNEAQFARFMHVIRELGEKVERERLVQLHDLQNLRKQEQEYVNETIPEEVERNGKSIDSTAGAFGFEALVGHTNAASSNTGAMETLLTPEQSLPGLLESMSVGQGATPTKPRPSVLSTNTIKSGSARIPRVTGLKPSATPIPEPTSSGLFEAMTAAPERSVGMPLHMQSTHNSSGTNTPTHAPPGWQGGLLQPKSNALTPKHAAPPSKSAWADFDPLL
ncbi:Protein kinase domain-containing protein ppk32 [Malassezia vespertilionis]|uniref:Protein kinase domain-containing protein ppk32 n=1 Tax=Malassezia vespertilionis TaxID=2020962 RepID=UPI0024B18E7A|nr:Protein kinase domain-containing protein ppk32 [Malassezia vespertilionis]WFD06664.1 Protein kinase domain-containing protein ppk32 [Malassezia vespertilionis]